MKNISSMRAPTQAGRAVMDKIEGFKTVSRYGRADVWIQHNGTLLVTESISVNAKGKNIRRGIYRDFPTRYRDRLGNHYTVEFEVISVQRNGAAESWHTEKRSNGIRVYVGSAKRELTPGQHDYEIRFQTTRQLGFFESHDELWWNVTGNGWMFPIDRAAATIHLPADVAGDRLELSAWTGAFGSTDSHARSLQIDPRTVQFETTRELASRAGLTVVVAFPKGLVMEPALGRKVAWFLSDNGTAVALLAGLLAALGWYLYAWHRVGRDPKKGVIIPRFEPPSGLSPAACSYVVSFRPSAFVAALISLAIKKHLLIREEGRLRERGQGQTTTGERSCWKRFYHRNIRPLSSIMKITSSAKSELKKALKKEPHVFAFFHGLFVFLMRAPTQAGRAVMDKIEGFKMYLDTAEQARLDHMRSPELTPEVFEAFLPYAYAMGVENNWCERFARELPQALQKQGGYHPAWYLGNFHGISALHHVGDNFSSEFSSAISSASAAPGSSSGSGGGGFSGGGGGGGGGGGW